MRDSSCNLLADLLSTAVVLGITSTRGKKASHVPSAVYIIIIVIQCAGALFASFISPPSRIRRNDGRPIALFQSLKWSVEFLELPKSVLKPGTLLLALAFFSSQLPFAFFGSLNAFYFNARTRALANVSSLLPPMIQRLFSDSVSSALFLGICRLRKCHKCILLRCRFLVPATAGSTGSRSHSHIPPRYLVSDLFVLDYTRSEPK